MKNNLRLTMLLGALAVFVAGAGLESPTTDEAASPHATSWADAFPVGQAGFAKPAAAD